MKLVSQIGSDEAVVAGLEFLDEADAYLNQFLQRERDLSSRSKRCLSA